MAGLRPSGRSADHLCGLPFWWPASVLYVRRSGLGLADQPEVQRGVQLLLDLVLHPSWKDTCCSSCPTAPIHD